MSTNKFSSSYNFIRNGLFETHLRNFITKAVHKNTGMSFKEYISNTRYEIESINRVCDDFNKEQATVNGNLLNKLQVPST